MHYTIVIFCLYVKKLLPEKKKEEGQFHSIALYVQFFETYVYVYTQT